ncbi:MAG: hypothetical protein FJW61_09540 [Actinobacteria bacterium]|nr:hypothetical protein [Actinomycetota bacterium]
MQLDRSIGYSAKELDVIRSLVLAINLKIQQLYKSLYDDYLSLGNFTELILYIYITENIDKKILNLFKLDFGIMKIN